MIRGFLARYRRRFAFLLIAYDLFKSVEDQATDGVDITLDFDGGYVCDFVSLD